MLAVAYEKTQELARDLQAVGCGDLDVEGNELTSNMPDFLHCKLVNPSLKGTLVWNIDANGTKKGNKKSYWLFVRRIF